MSAEKLRTDKTCLNCGHQVEDTFCSHCGQKNVELHDSFFHLAAHFITDYFHFDSKMRRSLVPLLFKPGYLPKLYLKGERASHINPVGTLIFLSAVFFILFKDSDAKLVNLNVNEEKPKAGMHINWSYPKDSVEDSIVQKEVTDSLKQAVLDSIKIEGTGRAALLQKTALERLKAIVKGDDAAREMFYEKLKHNFAKVVLGLIPLLAFILWLVYFRRKTLYFSHLILVVYVHCFIYLLLTIAAVLALLDLHVYNWVFYMMAIYIVLAMKNFYGQGWFKTIFKFCIVAGIYLVFFVLGMALDAIISLL